MSAVAPCWRGEGGGGNFSAGAGSGGSGRTVAEALEDVVQANHGRHAQQRLVPKLPLVPRRPPPLAPRRRELIVAAAAAAAAAATAAAAAAVAATADGEADEVAAAELGDALVESEQPAG